MGSKDRNWGHKKTYESVESNLALMVVRGALFSLFSWKIILLRNEESCPFVTALALVRSLIIGTSSQYSNRSPLLLSPLKSPADLDIPKGLQPLLTALSSHCPRKGVSGLRSQRPCSKPLAVVTLLSPRLVCPGLYPLPTLVLFSMLFV